ncbi:15.4 kDa class V heat shock protein [Malania oleifera]|uniref:15.4 kDa class V heat shock protein n=1 Tax=Malania oleifera TaxID=397392 RepID=UPI0025AE951A|nr:15.4 kDa class V heat shock protein [Malania oleifera]
MEFSTSRHPSWPFLFTSPLLFPFQFTPENYVHWTETPEAHIFSADLPGLRKEEIRVEVEDSIYLIIRTEAAGESTEPARIFMRKFRLPGMVDIDNISAIHEDGILTVTVPRRFVRRGFYIEPTDLPERPELLARAA